MVSVAGFMASVNAPADEALTVSWNVVVLSAWPVAVPFHRDRRVARRRVGGGGEG